MIPTLPFILGLVAGAAAVAALRSERGRAWLGSSAQELRQTCDQAERQVSAAARSGLERLRATLPPCSPEPSAAPSAPAAAAAETAAAAEPVAEPAIASSAPPKPRRSRSPSPLDGSRSPRARRTAASPATDPDPSRP